jgi:signal transduction histidine kinase/ActR/RegA family two-component response regulator
LLRVFEAASRLAAARRWWAAHPRAAAIFLNGLVAAGYWALAEAVVEPVTWSNPNSMPAMWPSAGLAVVAAWRWGFSLLPGVYLGATAVAWEFLPLPLAAVAAIGSVIECVVDVRLMRALKFDDRLERVIDPVVLALAVAPAGALASAGLGLGGLALAGGVAFNFALELLLWFLRDWLGVMLVTSLVFSWTRSRPLGWTWRRAAELGALVAMLLLAVRLVLALWDAFGVRNVPMAFLFFPLVGWVGLRFGPRGASFIVAVCAALATALAAYSIGPFGYYPAQFIQVSLSAFLLLASLSGQVLAAVMAERDDALARRLLLEEQLRHSQKMEAVGRLAGGIAHDFNNLLTAIIGYTEIVLTSLDPKDNRRADAEEIARAAMRAADLTRQMLAFSRRQVLQPKIVDLNTAVAKVEPMLKRVIGEDIVMTLAPRATNARVRVDPGQIEQVVMNLVVNARDAMPQGGRLTVETSDAVLDEAAAARQPDARAGSYVALSVTDTGVGMPPEVRSRIFEPYFTTKEVGKGTGLGLSTVYGIVRQSEGHIAVASEPGLGTTFRVYLPRAEAEAREAADTGEEKLPEGTEHVLLVEDEASVRRLSKELLTRLGYSVTEAASGRAGLALGSDDTRHFDLALCDVILGDMSGPAVAEALRALRPSIRVLYMSGYTDEAIVRTGVLDEGKPFLQKPFTPMQLAKKVREVLDEAVEETS